MTLPTSIATFLHAVQSQMNRSVLRRAAVAALTLCAMACILWALAWRVFGYAAPIAGYLVVGILCVAILAIRYRLQRHDIHRTALRADDHFQLKDALLSFLDFHQRQEHDAEVYHLQQESVEQSIATRDASTIACTMPRRQLWVAALLSLSAIVLALLPHSIAIQQRIEQEKIMLVRTEQIHDEMQKIVEEMIAAMDEKEKELLKPEQLREWVKDLEATKDQREAMKKLAKFEQKVSEAMKGLEARKDEEVLKLAAAELDASKLADAKQLGKKLENKDFENAKQQLGQLKPSKPKDLKKLSPEEMKKLLEKSAKMKEMSRRMANGANKRDFGQQGKNGKNIKPADGKDAADAKEMDQLLEELDQAAADADQQLQEMEEGDPDDGGAMEAMEKLDQKLDQLGKRLGKLDAKQKNRARMKTLGKMAGQSQKFANGQSQMLGLGQQAQLGGLKPGVGHSDAKREGNDQAKDQENLTQLKGQQGQGPSRSSIEQADSGEGISGRAGTDKNRDFRKQTESLVQRDDVPEELKQGIREYFNRVHEVDQPEK